MLHNNSQGVHAYNGATASNYFLNRHLNPMANYADAGSSVTFDGGPVFGGNYQPGGKVLTDAYPYNNEQLGRTPSIGVTLPVAGTFASIGSRKIIEWRSTACTYVDIYYKSAGTGQQPIVSNYPDVGVYQWTVPAIAAAADYIIVIDCNNSAGASLGVSASSGVFSITADRAGIAFASGKPSCCCRRHNESHLEAECRHYRSSQRVLSRDSGRKPDTAREQHNGK